MARTYRSRSPVGNLPTLRVIGGAWRSRRLPIIDRPGLRPTPDRVRETLFNWLAPRLDGAVCIDLFAGSGALGIEALSRGAAHVVFVEADRAAAAAIQDTLKTLGATDRATVCCEDAARPPSALGGHAVDIAFIDPPFSSALHAPALESIGRALAPEARLYLEYPLEQTETVADMLAADYDILRSSRAAGVAFCLATPRRASAPET